MKYYQRNRISYPWRLLSPSAESA